MARGPSSSASRTWSYEPTSARRTPGRTAARSACSSAGNGSGPRCPPAAPRPTAPTCCSAPTRASAPNSPQRCRAAGRADARIVLARPGTAYQRQDAHTFTLDPGRGADVDRLFADCAADDLLPGVVLHAWNDPTAPTASQRARWTRRWPAAS
ncbi:hypothetical protein O1L55_09510 [Streptomyces albulus]|nr:hypothetical protein [Streptomyces noursei]